MGSPTDQQKQNQSTNKSNWFDRYKTKVMMKELSKIEEYEKNSGSKIFYDRILMTILDVVTWIIIGIFVYIWWTTRGQAKIIGCEDISVDMCNSCYGVAKEIAKAGLGVLP